MIPSFDISSDLSDWLDTRPGSRSVARLGSAWQPRYPQTPFSRPGTDPAETGAGGEGETAKALRVDATAIGPGVAAGAVLDADTTVTTGDLVTIDIDIEIISGSSADPYGRICSIGRSNGSIGYGLVVTDTGAALLNLADFTVVTQALGISLAGRFQVRVVHTAGTATFYEAADGSPLAQVGAPQAFTLDMPPSETIGAAFPTNTFGYAHDGLEDIYGFTVTDPLGGTTKFDPRDVTGWDLPHATVVTP